MRGSRMMAVAIAFVAAGLLVGRADLAGAAPTYLFDAARSLTGDCTVSTADPVPDPPLPDCSAGPHPSSPLTVPHGAAIDLHGNIYVSSTDEATDESQIAIFDPSGLFVSEFEVPATVIAVAVDSKGQLYLREILADRSRQVSRYEPIVYEPATSNIDYDPTATIVVEHDSTIGTLPFSSGIAINPSNDHLFIHYEISIEEFSSAEEGNEPLDAAIGSGMDFRGSQLAIDAAHGRLYSDDRGFSFEENKVQVFELEEPHAVLETVKGEDLEPAQEFSPILNLATEEESGQLFIDIVGRNKILRLNEDYELVEEIKKFSPDSEPSGVVVSNAAGSENHKVLYKTTMVSGKGHLFAFEPPEPPTPPEIVSLSFGEVSETEATFFATINPNKSPTEYTFEYTSADDPTFANGIVAGQGTIPAGNEGVTVSASVSGLLPGTAYRFRVVAANEAEGENEDEEEGLFTTYLANQFAPCPNDAFRLSSAPLPDCRAYELVTPSDTNGRSPQGAGGSGPYFPMLQASPQGDAASFKILGGILPGSEGIGLFGGQQYASVRGADGWHTSLLGPNGSETTVGNPGGVSPDQGYTFWETGSGEYEDGTAEIDDETTTYIRYPDGHSELIGRGSLGTDPQVEGNLITEDAAHTLFRTTNAFGHVAQQLEPNAPPDGTAAVYDRTRDPETGIETTHVVSLLPGEITPAAGQNAIYVGASWDGEGIAFSIGETLFLRLNNVESFEIGTGVEFAGVSAGGGRIFYLEGGDLHAFDTAEEEVIDFSESGDVTVVNVAEGGTGAYFVSPSVLTGAANPNGDTAKAGEQNLYLSEEGQISFVGTVSDRDVEGESTSGGAIINGLGLWTVALLSGDPGWDPSRSTPDGSVLLFESREDLTGFASSGHAQVFRYDSAAERLICLSCAATGAGPSTDANLQSVDDGAPFSAGARLPNLRDDGHRAFFHSTEPLVATDGDGLQDVYEWEEEGVGSCTRPGGCVYLISSGRSAQHDFLYGVSESGEDVFFLSTDRLVGRDLETTRSIYDARVGGGFPEPQVTTCNAEGCRPQLGAAPALPSSPSEASTPQNPPRSCPKGKHKVKRHGKVVCVKKKKHKKHHRNQRRHQGGNQ